MLKFILVGTLVLFVTSCGKGFDKQSTQATRETQTADPLTVMKIDLLEMINLHRSKLRLKPLIESHFIEDTAQLHSINMGKLRRPFGHQGFSARCRRIRELHAQGNACGEIVAMGQKSAQEIFNSWMRSPLHRKEIENPIYTHTGIGLYENSSNTIYATEMFLEI